MFLSTFIFGLPLLGGYSPIKLLSPYIQAERVPCHCQQVSLSVCQLTRFLKNASQDFSQILHGVEGSQGSQTEEAEFFRKILAVGKKPKTAPRFFWLLPRISYAVLFYTLKMVHNNVLYVFAKVAYLRKIQLSYGPKCSQPIRLQDSLIVRCSEKFQSRSQIFYIEIVIKGKQYLRLPLICLVVARSVSRPIKLRDSLINLSGRTQSTSNSFIQSLCFKIAVSSKVPKSFFPLYNSKQKL